MSNKTMFMKAWVVTTSHNICEKHFEKVITLLPARYNSQKAKEYICLLYQTLNLLPDETLPYIRYKKPEAIPTFCSNYYKIIVGWPPANYITAYKANKIHVDCSSLPQKVSWLVPAHEIVVQTAEHKLEVAERVKEAKYTLEAIMPLKLLEL